MTFNFTNYFTDSNVFIGFRGCRTEYWKSLPKKYCDFCKCWITDNKAVLDNSKM